MPEIAPTKESRRIPRIRERTKPDSQEDSLPDVCTEWMHIFDEMNNDTVVDGKDSVREYRRGKSTEEGIVEYSFHETTGYVASDGPGLDTIGVLSDIDDVLPHLSTWDETALWDELACLDSKFMPQEADQVGIGLGSNSEHGSACGANSSQVITRGGCQEDKRPQRQRTGSGAERQRRYRQKKKEEEKCAEEELQNAMAALNCAREQNMDLKRRESATWSLLESIDNLNANQKENIHIGDLYASVVSTFKKEILKSENESSEKFTDEIQNMIQLIPRQNMYLLFREQVNCLLKEYDASQDPVRRASIEVQMKQLFGMRTHAIAELAQKHPKIVLSHLIEGWVGETYNEGIMPQNIHRFDDVTVKTLVNHLHISQEQIEGLCRHWKSFLAHWNKSMGMLQKCISDLPENPNIQEICPECTQHTEINDISDITNFNGLQDMTKKEFSIQAVTRELENVSEEQILSVLELAGNICTVLSPIQKARLCVFYSSAPNCMYLPYMLTKLPLQ